MLATGGAGKVYLYTTNPDVATGDGVAMAYRAGARIANMEFFQFHPTCLYHPQAKTFLISEALRGEGGILRLRDGTAFMERYHAMKDLAPRDVVARAIDSEMKRTGDDCVVLDMTHLRARLPARALPEHPRPVPASSASTCARQPIPVVPAAHYRCGGVVVDDDGRTSVRGLYAIGEVAMTGLHGACRLASNSLLEGLVFGRARRRRRARRRSRRAPPTSRPGTRARPRASDEAVVVTPELGRDPPPHVELRRHRPHRQAPRARRAAASSSSATEIREYYWNFSVNGDLLELRNIALVAELIIERARRRKESRGLHYNLDHPDKDPRWSRTRSSPAATGPCSRTAAAPPMT